MTQLDDLKNTGKITDKEYEQYSSVSSKCDHTKFTETINELKCCFCCKLSHVIRARKKITSTEFVEEMRKHAYKRIDWAEVDRRVKEELAWINR